MGLYGALTLLVLIINSYDCAPGIRRLNTNYDYSDCDQSSQNNEVTSHSESDVLKGSNENLVNNDKFKKNSINVPQVNSENMINSPQKDYKPTTLISQPSAFNSAAEKLKETPVTILEGSEKEALAKQSTTSPQEMGYSENYYSTPKDVEVLATTTNNEEISNSTGSTIVDDIFYSVKRLHDSLYQGLKIVSEATANFFTGDQEGNTDPKPSSIKEVINNIHNDFDTKLNEVRNQFQNFIQENQKNSALIAAENLSTGLKNIQDIIASNFKVITLSMDAVIQTISLKSNSTSSEGSRKMYKNLKLDAMLESNKSNDVKRIKYKQERFSIPSDSVINNENYDGRNEGLDLSKDGTGNLNKNDALEPKNNDEQKQPLTTPKSTTNKNNSKPNSPFLWNKWISPNSGSQSRNTSSDRPQWQSWLSGVWQSATGNLTTWNQNFQNWFQNVTGMQRPLGDEVTQRPANLVQAAQQSLFNIQSAAQNILHLGNGQPKETSSEKTPPESSDTIPQKVPESFNKTTNA